MAHEFQPFKEIPTEGLELMVKAKKSLKTLLDLDSHLGNRLLTSGNGGHWILSIKAVKIAIDLMRHLEERSFFFFSLLDFLSLVKDDEPSLFAWR